MSTKKLVGDRNSRRSSRGSPTGSGILNIDSAINKKIQKLSEKEDHELVVYTIREELIEKVMDVIHERYMEKQCVKFTVHCAYRALVQLLNYHYFRRDPGKPFYKNHPSWAPDVEPESSPPDTWAGYKTPIHPKPIPEPISSVSEVITEVSQPSLNMYENTFETHSVETAETKTSTEDSTCWNVIYETKHSERTMSSSDYGFVVSAPKTSQVVSMDDYGEEEEEEELEYDDDSIALRELSIFTKTAKSYEKESLPQPMSLGFSKIKDMTLVDTKLPKIILDPLPSLSKTGFNMTVESLPPLRAEAKYKPAPPIEIDDKLHLKKK